jgi:hypothetical protein
LLTASKQQQQQGKLVRQAVLLPALMGMHSQTAAGWEVAQVLGVERYTAVVLLQLLHLLVPGVEL